MADAIERVLRLVSEGGLTAEEAEPILAAMSGGEQGEASGQSASHPREAASGPSDGTRYAHIEVREGGRRAVDLRVPFTLGSLGIGSIPGLSPENVERLREAIAAGATGPVFQVEDEDGDGVRIVIE
jgi:hypothetical protein